MRITTVKKVQVKRGLRVAVHETEKGNTRTNEIAAPFGIDINPYLNIKAIVSRATTAGRGVVLGFINKFLAALPGEIRIYSTDADGNDVVAYMHFKNDGTIHITGNIFHTGDIDINGDLTIAGSITGTGGDCVFDGISLKTHTHNYFDDGNPNVTSPPN